MVERSQGQLRSGYSYPDNSSVRGKASLLSGAGTDNTAPFEAAAEGMRGEWAQLNAQWKSAGVSPEILARQANLEAAFEQKHAELMG